MSAKVCPLRLLGPLRIDGVAPADLGGPKQQAMLAYLAIHAGQLVSTDELIDAVWGDDAPPTASAVVYGYVRRIRDLLARTPAALLSESGGYRLDMPRETSDTEVFARLSAEGLGALGQGRLQAAEARLGEALELWRGAPLEGLGELPFLTAFRSKLDAARLTTRLGHLEARLALGGARELAVELRALSAERPCDESIARLLMLALYRSGGQVEALATYRELRRRLAEELGIEPSRSLQELEAAILRQDPSLDEAARPILGPDATTAPSAAAMLPTSRPSARGLGRPGSLEPLTRGAIAATAVALVLVGGAIASSALGGPNPSARGSERPSAVTQASTHATPPEAEVLATWTIPQPSCCGIGPGTAWGVGHHDDHLRAIDTATNRMSDLGDVAGYQSGIPEPLAGSVWIPSARGPLVRFDPSSRTTVGEVSIASTSVAFAFLDIWATTRDHHLDRISIATNDVVASIPVGSGENDWDDGLAISSGAVWDSNGDAGALLKIDPGTNRVIDRIGGFGSSDSGAPIAFGEGSIWLLRAVGAQMTLFRIDPQADRIVATIAIGPPFGGNTGTVTVGGGFAWTATWDGSISQVDARTNSVVAVRSLPAIPQNITFGGGGLWVDAYDADAVWRIAPGG